MENKHILDVSFFARSGNIDFFHSIQLSFLGCWKQLVIHLNNGLFINVDLKKLFLFCIKVPKEHLRGEKIRQCFQTPEVSIWKDFSIVNSYLFSFCQKPSGLEWIFSITITWALPQNPTKNLLVVPINTYKEREELISRQGFIWALRDIVDRVAGKGRREKVRSRFSLIYRGWKCDRAL